MRVLRISSMKSRVPSAWMLLLMLLAVTLGFQQTKAQDNEESTETNQTDNDQEEIIQMTRIHHAAGDNANVPTAPTIAPVATDSNAPVTTVNVEIEETTSTSSAPVPATESPNPQPVATVPSPYANIDDAIATFFNQGQSQNANVDRQGGSGNRQEVDLEDPVSLHVEAMSMLQNMSSLQDLISSGMVYKDGRPVSETDLGAQYNSTTGKMYINAASRAEMPKSDECEPRLTTIVLNITNVDASTIVFPRCIKEYRCGGCCRVTHVECVPMYPETKLYNLLLLRPTMVRSRVHLESAGYHTVRVDRHLICQCKCTLTEDSCGPNKHLLFNQCRCECNSRVRCTSPSVFNDETCQCECPQHIRDECTDGRLNPTTCICGPRSYISVSGSRTSNIIHVLSNSTANTNAVAPLANPTAAPANTQTIPTTPCTPTTTTTTTTNPTPAPSCAGLRCPLSHEPYLHPSGVCRCRLRNRGGRYNPRGGRPRGGMASSRMGNRYRPRG